MEPAAGQQLITWTADASAWKFYVFQSTAGGAFVDVASVLLPSALPPAPTTWTATGLAGGVSYCYAIEAVYTDGSMSDLGIPGCGVATGTDIASSATSTILLGAANAVASNASIIRNQPDNILTTGPTVLFWTLPMRAGDRLKNGAIVVVGDGLVDITTISLDVVSASDNTTNLVNGAFSNVPLALNSVPFSIPSPIALGVTDRVVLKMVVNAGGLTVGSFSASYDHPTP
jgi:hypothetical protein